MANQVLRRNTNRENCRRAEEDEKLVMTALRNLILYGLGKENGSECETAYDHALLEEESRVSSILKKVLLKTGTPKEKETINVILQDGDQELELRRQEMQDLQESLALARKENDEILADNSALIDELNFFTAACNDLNNTQQRLHQENQSLQEQLEEKMYADHEETLNVTGGAVGWKEKDHEVAISAMKILWSRRLREARGEIQRAQDLTKKYEGQLEEACEMAQLAVQKCKDLEAVLRRCCRLCSSEANIVHADNKMKNKDDLNHEFQLNASLNLAAPAAEQKRSRRLTIGGQCGKQGQPQRVSPTRGAQQSVRRKNKFPHKRSWHNDAGSEQEEEDEPTVKASISYLADTNVAHKKKVRPHFGAAVDDMLECLLSTNASASCNSVLLSEHMLHVDDQQARDKQHDQRSSTPRPEGRMFLAAWVMRRRRLRNEKNIKRNGCAAGLNCFKKESDDEQNIQVVESSNDPAKAFVGQRTPSFPTSAESILSRSASCVSLVPDHIHVDDQQARDKQHDQRSSTPQREGRMVRLA
jgi:hypothetical protein